MFDVLTKGFRGARAKLQGRAIIDEAAIADILRDIRVSLLEADVALPVVTAFLDRVREKALGEVVQVKVKGGGKELSPADHFVKLCHDELIALMGEGQRDLVWSRDGRPTIVMMVGLHGTGKTTTSAKLARLLKDQKKKPMLVAADIYRPAAIEQLKILGQKIGVPVYSVDGMSPPDLCQSSIKYAAEHNCNVIIFDTAGRLAIDEPLMAELTEIKARTKPTNIYLVVDAMIGQDSVRMASEFDRQLDITGVVMTKMDGDARGGAALSVKGVTGKPIVFAGMGEAMDKLEPFRPEGIATRILGFGDVVGLVQDFEKVVDEKKAEEDALKILKGEFTLYQFMDQIKSIQKMGSLKGTLEKLPFFHEMVPDGATVDEKSLGRIEAMIHSMTPDERNDPKIILAQGRNDTRARRIARGSGHKPQDVKDLVQRFETMREVMKQVGKNPALLGRLPGFRESIELAKSRGEDIGDFDPGRMDPRMMQPYGGGQRKMSNADKEKRRKKEKEARKARKKARR
ncbi:MAG TPA: signal recognition particle protein [Myxococcota bacterium]|nr:signal recognition particle protein [Myxococcota bacterium]HNZ03443.1 signal recognition particle protein [Myxococcota bacterium]HOD07631.1 signal recognition particle protein [Myxococcota bacterium]HPB49743.1 signal recognition particle protein [Myxococcota bacterium]HQP94743.1 signal recognition particle protein [Myxococcota bacterium]